MELNVPLLDSVMKQITEFPELHDQGWFFTDTDCGTACCFAGWACVLAGYEPDMAWGDNRGAGVNSPDGVKGAWEVAQELLGLTDDQALVLFGPCNTRGMLDAMVQDLIHSNQLQDFDYYCDRAALKQQ